MASPDITDRLENLREHLSPERVRRAAAFRARMWEQCLERREERSLAFESYCRETARQWREVAGE